MRVAQNGCDRARARILSPARRGRARVQVLAKVEQAHGDDDLFADLFGHGRARVRTRGAEVNYTFVVAFAGAINGARSVS
jgi:hypothetical protein